MFLRTLKMLYSDPILAALKRLFRRATLKSNENGSLTSLTSQNNCRSKVSNNSYMASITSGQISDCDWLRNTWSVTAGSLQKTNAF